MRVVWAIKDYLCLQGPHMFMASHAGRAAAEHRMVGNQAYCLFDSHKVFASKPQSNLPTPSGHLYSPLGAQDPPICLLPPPLLGSPELPLGWWLPP